MEFLDLPGPFRQAGDNPRLLPDIIGQPNGENAPCHFNPGGHIVITIVIARFRREPGINQVMQSFCVALVFTPGKQTDNYGFAAWVKEREASLAAVLGDGTHFGEWWGQGIQRRYGLTEKRLSLFNVKKWGWLDDSAERAFRVGPDLSQLHVVPVLWRGDFDITMIEAALADLKQHGSKAAPGFMDPEGVVVFHSASSTLFKKTLKNDEHKGENA